jgi:dTDP-glucose 4,6-dehydratase
MSAVGCFASMGRDLTSTLLNDQLFIHGSGKARRDWLYVVDTCERIDRVLHTEDDKVRGEVFNLGEKSG